MKRRCRRRWVFWSSWRSRPIRRGHFSRCRWRGLPDLARFPFAEVYWLPRDVGHQLAHGTLLVEAVRQRVDIPASACAQAQSPAESSLSDEVLWERAAGGNAFMPGGGRVFHGENAAALSDRRTRSGSRYRQLHGLLVLNARPFSGIDAGEGHAAAIPRPRIIACQRVVRPCYVPLKRRLQRER